MDTEKQDEYSTLARKLFNVQQGLSVPKNQVNSFGKYKYRSCEDILEAVKPLLRENECMITLEDSLEMVGDRIYIKAIANFIDPSPGHDNPGKHHVIFATAYAREPLTKKGMDESQITGTASSYARKYALNGLLCIDDTKDADTMDNRARRDKPKEEREPIDTDAHGEPFNDGGYKVGEVYEQTKNNIGVLCQHKGWKRQPVADWIKEKYGKTLAGMKDDDNLLVEVFDRLATSYTPPAIVVGDE